MKGIWSRTVNMLMGLLLLISFSYSIPSASPLRNIPRTEWIKTENEGGNDISVRKKWVQPISISSAEFAFRILDCTSRIKTYFQQNKSFQITFSPARLSQSKILSNDDDYLLS